MAVADSKKKEINFKIVYYGPARSGKTTSIKQLQSLLSAKSKSKVQKSNHASEETIFFDFLALTSEQIGHFKTRFQIYTVPGQILYEDTRRLLLKGADGVIFVADSQMEKIQENIQSLEELITNVRKLGMNPQEIPIIIQYNKRDLPTPAVEELRRVVNTIHVPDFETIATTGAGVLETFQECVRQVVMNLKEA